MDYEQSLKNILDKITKDPNICPKYRDSLKSENFQLNLSLCNVCGQVHLIEGTK